MNIVVVGGGVVGLSVATHLAQMLSRKAVVTLIAEKFSPHTTSDKSGSYIVSAEHVGTREHEWTRSTFKRIHELYNSPEGGKIGASLVHGYVTNRRSEGIGLGFRRVELSEKKMFPDWGEDVFAFSTYLVNCRVYLPWLQNEFIEAGGITLQKKVHSLSELSSFDVIINCAGLGAAELTADTNLYPASGHIVLVSAPWVTQFILEPESVATRAYIFPRMDGTILGGTCDEGNSSEVVDDREVQGILRRCLSKSPSLAGAEILDSWVGIRPMRRGGTRLEKEEGSSSPVIIHCYGHGHHGVSQSWGCAEEIANIVADLAMVSKL